MNHTHTQRHLDTNNQGKTAEKSKEHKKHNTLSDRHISYHGVFTSVCLSRICVLFNSVSLLIYIISFVFVVVTYSSVLICFFFMYICFFLDLGVVWEVIFIKLGSLNYTPNS